MVGAHLFKEDQNIFHEELETKNTKVEASVLRQTGPISSPSPFEAQVMESSI